MLRYACPNSDVLRVQPEVLRTCTGAQYLVTRGISDIHNYVRRNIAIYIAVQARYDAQLSPRCSCHSVTSSTWLAQGSPGDYDSAPLGYRGPTSLDGVAFFSQSPPNLHIALYGDADRSSSLDR
jgi:hypothetical protein